MSTYSFLDVTATLVGPGGALSLGAGAGASEEGITVESTGEMGTMMIGADGSGQHSLSGDKSGRIVVRLLKTSPVNAQLNAMAQFQRASADAYGQNTLVITDTSRGDVVTCRQVAFAKQPSLTFGREAGMNEWEFNAVIIDPALG